MIVRNGCVVDEEEQREQGEEGQQQGQRTIGGYVKVMTDEQIEILRRQISDYATICEQLVEMHKALTAQQDSIAGMKLGNMYCDPLMGGGHKIATRQRWTPSQMQLQILESIFEQGNGTPSKQKIKDIASELVQHGPISETNVYNWFQNRRARSKRKQQAVASNNAESEVEIEVDSLSEKKAKAEDFQCSEKSSFHADGLGFQGQEVSSCVRLFDPELSHVPSNENFKSCGSLPPLSFFDSMLTNIRVDHLMGRTEGPDFSSFHTNKGFHMIG